MQLEHSFTVPVGIERAWPVLLDLERVAACMPGARIDSLDGDDFSGTVRVKIGPISLTYKGTARLREKDEQAHRAVIEARGRDTRGGGTASATVTATLSELGGQTRVSVLTDLDITGKPAQFGRGVLVDVSNKLIGQFADCLAGKLTESQPTGTTETTPTVASSTTASEATADRPVVSEARPQPAEAEPINLIGSAGPALARRLAPVAGAIVLTVLLLRQRRRRRLRRARGA